jgi:hypothetical protein
LAQLQHLTAVFINIENEHQTPSLVPANFVSFNSIRWRNATATLNTGFHNVENEHQTPPQKETLIVTRQTSQISKIIHD